MKARMLKLGLVALIALGVPAAAVAHGPDDAAKGLAIAAQNAQGNVPTSVGSGKPEAVGKPETSGQPEDPGRPTDNHGWFVSQEAKNKSAVGSNAQGHPTHGEAVSGVAQSDQGLPSAATSHP